MKLIVCLDKNGGITFNNRRQSRDRVLLEDIKSFYASDPLTIRPYSEKLALEAEIPYTVTDAPFENSAKNSYIFIEEKLDLPDPMLVDEVIIYKWNTSYPYDAKFEFDLSDFKLCEKKNFKGYSHKKITKEVYKR